MTKFTRQDMAQVIQKNLAETVEMLSKAKPTDWVIWFRDIDLCIGEDNQAASPLHAQVMDQETAEAIAHRFSNGAGQVAVPAMHSTALAFHAESSAKLVEELLALGE